MFRLQRALPERYVDATPDQLAAWIGRGQGRARVPGAHPRAPLPARRGDALGRCPGRLLRPVAHSPRTAATPTTSSSAASTSWPSPPTSSPAPHQQVILPDLNAGCSMADMADIDAVEEAWESLAAVTDVERVVPVTYMNSSAALKAFVGRHGGAVCTSSNARAVLDLGARTRPTTGAAPRRQGPLLPRPAPRPQHRVRARLRRRRHAGVEPPARPWAASTTPTSKTATLLLWKGHCSVHQRFRPEHVDAFRAEHPGGLVVIHPECAHDVVEMADKVGSTDFIIRAVDEAPPGSVIGVGTEIHLVKRLDDEHPDKTVVSLDPLVCPCSTMFRIDAAHLAWVLERLVDGEVGNRITVDEPPPLGPGGPRAHAGSRLSRRLGSGPDRSAAPPPRVGRLHRSLGRLGLGPDRPAGPGALDAEQRGEHLAGVAARGRPPPRGCPRPRPSHRRVAPLGAEVDDPVGAS